MFFFNSTVVVRNNFFSILGSLSFGNTICIFKLGNSFLIKSIAGAKSVSPDMSKILLHDFLNANSNNFVAIFTSVSFSTGTENHLLHHK